VLISPDPELTRVVLIGTWDYEHEDQLPPLPAVRNNLHDLSRAFTDSNFGITTWENCVTVDTPDSPASFMGRLRKAADQASDVLLVYYAGHGIRHETRNELYLTVRQSDPDGPDGTAVPFTWVRDAIERSAARVKLLILDCCYSGMALGIMSPGGVDARDVEVTGTSVITSTSKNKVSHSPPGERNTAFTGGLVDLLTQGSPFPGEELTVQATYRALRANLARRSFPLPKLKVSDTSGDFLLRRSKALSGSDAEKVRIVPPAAEVMSSLAESAVPVVEPVPVEAESAVPVVEPGSSGAESAVPVAEPGSSGAESAVPVAESAVPVEAELGSSVAESAPPMAVPAPSAAEPVLPVAEPVVPVWPEAAQEPPASVVGDLPHPGQETQNSQADPGEPGQSGVSESRTAPANPAAGKFLNPLRLFGRLLLWIALAFFVDYSLGGLAGFFFGTPPPGRSPADNLILVAVMLPLAALSLSAIRWRLVVQRRRGNRLTFRADLREVLGGTLGKLPVVLVGLVGLFCLAMAVSGFFLSTASPPTGELSALSVNVCLILWFGEGAAGCSYAIVRRITG
jgi:hypothetical protein